ncbi:hypothetical protein ES708_29476 [subsurface metagenome]
MKHLKFYTLRINKTGKLHYAIADNAQHACAVNNLWVGACTILSVQELPAPIKAMALAISPQLNTGVAYRGEQKPT